MNDISEIILNFSGNVYDFCYYVLDKAEDKTKAFEIVCKEFVKIPENGKIEIPQFFTQDEIDKLRNLDGEMVDGLISSTIKKCDAGIIEKDNFYISLWNAFCTWFDDEKEQAFAMYYTVIDKRIPYISLGMPLSMSNERYGELIEINKEYLDKIKYIKRSEYTQRTEEASLLLNCLDEISDYESKVVVLAQAIKILAPIDDIGHRVVPKKDKLDAIMQLLSKKIKELEETDVSCCDDEESKSGETD